jgi:hypothetical protein
MRLCLAGLTCSVLLLGGRAAGAGAASWMIQPTPATGAAHGDLFSVSCTSSSICMAVGSTFADDPDVRVPLVERWNGASWQLQRPPSTRFRHGELLGVSCTSGEVCIAVGDFEARDGTELPLAERWNGRAWSVQHVPPPLLAGIGREEAVLGAVSCTSPTACTAVGAREISDEPLVERWNGEKWSIERTPSPGFDGGSLYGVSCGSRTACSAVGTYTSDATGCDVPLVERWHGERWSIERTPGLPCGQSSFSAISCLSWTDCTAVGSLYRSGGAYDSVLAERRGSGAWAIESAPSPRFRVDPWGGGAWLDDITCRFKSACIAVGGAGSEIKRVPIVEQRTGGRWNARVVRNLRDGEFFAVSCTSRSACTVVGVNDSAGQGSDVPLVERMS